MAPELFDEPRCVDIRADIYSFGIMLYEMITGSWPFDEATEELERLHKTQPLPQLPRTNPPLADVIQKCLSKQPEARFSDFAELADERTLLLKQSPAAGRRAPAKCDPGRALKLFEQDRLKEALQHLDPSQSDIDKAVREFIEGMRLRGWATPLQKRKQGDVKGL
jgi:serine/threonine protein kinase